MNLGLWPVGPLGACPVCGPGTLGAVDWDELERGISTVVPTVFDVASDLIQKRKNSLTGLQNKKAQLQKKLAKKSNPYDKANLEKQIKQIDAQIDALQYAISTDAPPSALDEQLEQSQPGASPVPWILGGIVLVGVGGTLIWALTKGKKK